MAQLYVYIYIYTHICTHNSNSDSIIIVSNNVLRGGPRARPLREAGPSAVIDYIAVYV